MGIIQYIGVVASSMGRQKPIGSVKRKKDKHEHPIHVCTKEQHLKWVEEGKCQCCGEESGEYKGICDRCRLT